MVGYVKGWLSINYNYNNAITTTRTITIQNKNYNTTNQDIKPSTNGGTTNDIRERAIGSKRFFGFQVFCGLLLLLSQR